MRDHCSGWSYGKMLKAKNVLFLLVVFILPLIFGEMLARILFPEPISRYIPSKNFRLIYELNPLYPEINSLGMRPGGI